ncbi:MAG: hypothetical protein HY814_13020 [Candidatus Riflebacteria bacterium]|nr:hypothetical protein [Candidatus Riflebacteria bacterium]
MLIAAALAAAIVAAAAPCWALGLRHSRLYPALAVETVGTQSQVERIEAQERARLDRAQEGAGPTLDEILRELEVAERSAGYTPALTPAAPPPVVSRPPAGPKSSLLQQLQLGHYSSQLQAANLTVPTTVDEYLQWSFDYRKPLCDRIELDLENTLHGGTLKTEDRFYATFQYNPEGRLRTRLREHLELQSNSSERLTNDYDLNSSELTIDYNFPVRLRALVRGFLENKSFDREGAFNFDSRAKETEFYVERPFMNGTYTAYLINEGQHFGSDPLSDFQRQTLSLSARGSLARLFDGEARFLRERQDRNLPGAGQDYDDNSWFWLLDYRINSTWLLRLERDLEDKLFVAPDDIDFNYRRTIWRPSVTYLPTRELTLIGEAILEQKRHFDHDPTDLILEHDEDFDTTTLSLTATYFSQKIYISATLLRAYHDHVLPDNSLQADFTSLELSGAATYTISKSKSVSLTYSHVDDSYRAIATLNDSSCMAAWLHGCMAAWLQGWVVGALGRWVAGWLNGWVDCCGPGPRAAERRTPNTQHLLPAPSPPGRFTRELPRPAYSSVRTASPTSLKSAVPSRRV